MYCGREGTGEKEPLRPRCPPDGHALLPQALCMCCSHCLPCPFLVMPAKAWTAAQERGPGQDFQLRKQVGRSWRRPTHQEPVKVHEGEKQQECVEKEVEGNVRHRAQAAVACGIQDLEGEPIEAEPEPVVGKNRSGRL